MRIANNVPALTAFNSLNSANNNLQKVIKQVSTGLRINSAADDAAGLAISENMRAQSTGLERAIRNAQDGISLLQTAEGALGETNSMLQRMRELAVQAANDTLTSQDRNFLQMEIDNLKDSINRIADTTQFNTKFILDGSSCGKCESTETTTKGYIKGAIDIEGNYKIQVRAKPGQAQVQKSTIFKVCNENVVTNQQLNANNGIGNVAIDNLPAGDYNITATQAGGGEPSYIYTQTTKVNVNSGNTSGTTETLSYRLKFTDNSGTSTSTLYWPNPSYTNIGNITSSDNEATAKNKIYELIKDALDGKNATVGSGENASSFDLEVDEEGNITSKTTQNKIVLSEIEFSVGGGETTTKLTNILTSSFDDASTHEASGMWSIAGDGDNESGTVTITVSDNGHSGSYGLSVEAGKLSDAIKGLNQQIELDNGDKITLTGGMVGTGFCSFTVNGQGESSSCSISVASDIANRTFTQSGAIKGPDTSYSYVSKGEGSVTTPNTSNSKETITVYLRPGSSSSSSQKIICSFTVDGLGSDATDTEKEAQRKNIASKIAKEVNGKYEPFAYNGKSDSATLIGTSSDDGTFTIQAINSKNKVYFSTSVSPSSHSTKIDNASFGDPESEIASVPSSALVSSSQFYCSEEAAESISPSVNSNTQNNASMIFEVTDKTYDQAAGGYILTLSAASNVLTADGNTARYSDDKIIISTGNKTVNIGSLLGEDESHMSLTLDPDKFEVGNKFVYNVSGNGTTATPVTTSLYMSHQQDAKWPQAWEWEEPYETTYPSSGPYFNVNADSISNREIHFRNFYLNTENGNVIDSDIKLAFNEDFGKRAASFPDAPEDPLNRSSEISLASFTSNYPGKVADGSTKLRDLDQFYNKSGVFMLEEPQKITITQNDGKKTQITLYGTDTLNDVAKKLNDAIADDLGQGMYVRGGDANKIVTFVENPTEGTGLETVEGTFIIRSLIPGTAGELTFSSSYGELIDNLGLNTVQNSDEGYYDVSVSNAHTGEIITGNVKIMGNMLRGVIHENIDVEFDPMAGVSAVWSEDDKNFILVPDEKPYTTFLHVVKNNISFHIGANEGEKIQLDIGDMTAAGLGLKSVSVTTAGRAERSITLLDEAIKRISVQRSKIGAYENALEHTIENLTTSNTNLIASESRIRDADMSKSMLDLVKYQIIHQSGTSMLAQANQLPQSVLNLIQ